MSAVPTLAEIKKNYQRISQWVVETPVWHYRNFDSVKPLLKDREIFFKLELLQQAGSFKTRGALTTLLHLAQEELQHGIVAATAGNHGIAVSYAAKIFNTSAKIVMPKTASPIRIAHCESYGAEVILMDSIKDVFVKMEEIAATENRTRVHPFEGPYIIMGTGSIGLELVQQIKNLDAVIIPIGGGGLCAGIALVIKQLLPNCEVFGVEPEGAPTMYRSLIAGKPVTLEKVESIADSLCAPQAMPLSFGLCQKYVDEVVLVTDAELRQAMTWLFYEMKLAVEPAAAAATAALFGPLKKSLTGKRVGLLISGTNIDLQRYCTLTS